MNQAARWAVALLIFGSMLFLAHNWFQEDVRHSREGASSGLDLLALPVATYLGCRLAGSAARKSGRAPLIFFGLALLWVTFHVAELAGMHDLYGAFGLAIGGIILAAVGCGGAETDDRTIVADPDAQLGTVPLKTVPSDETIRIRFGRPDGTLDQE